MKILQLFLLRCSGAGILHFTSLGQDTLYSAVVKNFQWRLKDFVPSQRYQEKEMLLLYNNVKHVYSPFRSFVLVCETCDLLQFFSIDAQGLEQFGPQLPGANGDLFVSSWCWG